jgi:predicted RNA-binding protein YlqC (UPF0109 family)
VSDQVNDQADDHANDQADDHADDQANDQANDQDGVTDTAPTAVAVLTHIVKSIVDDPDEVTVEVDESGHRPALNVRVGDGDLGRVIGRRGRTAASIRTVTRAAASKDDVEIDIEFLD